MSRLIFIIVVGISSITSVWAECSNGKSEILVFTPNGQQKFLCVPDKALKGIENAADHSSGLITAEPMKCGGIAAIQCPVGYACIDDSRDNCDPNAGGADCNGICVKTLN